VFPESLKTDQLGGGRGLLPLAATTPYPRPVTVTLRASLIPF